MNETATPDEIVLCQAQLRMLIVTWRSTYLQHAEDPAAYPIYRKVLVETLNGLPNPRFWNGLDLHTTLEQQVGTSILQELTTPSTVRDSVHTTQG